VVFCCFLLGGLVGCSTQLPIAPLYFCFPVNAVLSSNFFGSKSVRLVLENELNCQIFMMERKNEVHLYNKNILDYSNLILQ
jgi:hypothetical protein